MSAEDESFLRGAITALPTPFRDGVIDLIGLDRLVQHQARHDMTAIVVGGATGEGWSLDTDEVGQLVARAAQAAANGSRYRLHVIAGVCEIDSRRAARLAKHAALAGADAILASAPAFAHASKCGVVRHVRTIADALPSPLPIVLVNEPTRTGSDLTPKVIGRIHQAVPTLAASGSNAAAYVHVDDVDAWHRAMTTNAPDVSVVDVVDQPWGMREFSVTDPDGNVVRIGQNV